MQEVLAHTSICLDLPFEVGEVGEVCLSSPLNQRIPKCGLIPYQTVETEWTVNLTKSLSYCVSGRETLLVRATGGGKVVVQPISYEIWGGKGSGIWWSNTPHPCF